MLNPSVLMVIEPEKSKAEWEVWVKQATDSKGEGTEKMIKEKTRLLMQSGEFDVEK